MEPQRHLRFTFVTGARKLNTNRWQTNLLVGAWVVVYFGAAWAVMIILGNAHAVNPLVPAFGYRVVIRLQNIVIIWTVLVRVMQWLRREIQDVNKPR